MMSNKYKNEVENIFRTSNSTCELFDAFHFSLSQRIVDINTYKILLANPVLSKDELKLYTEKLCTVMTDKCYDIYTWCAGILENKTTDLSFIEEAIDYYTKASHVNPQSCEPYLKLINLYNHDIDFPTNKIILNIIDEGLDKIEQKSSVCRAVADIYKRIGNKHQMIKYIKLAEEYTRDQN